MATSTSASNSPQGDSCRAKVRLCVGWGYPDWAVDRSVLSIQGIIAPPFYQPPSHIAEDLEQIRKRGNRPI